MSSPQTTASDLAAVADAIRDHDRVRPHDSREPGRRCASARCSPRSSHSSNWARTPSWSCTATRRSRGEYAFMPLGDLQRRWPRRRRRSVSCSPSTARTKAGSPIPRCFGRVPLSIDVDHHHDNTRFGRINLIVADASSTGEVLARSLPRARRRADPGHRRGALHRARHRHRPLPVHEHDAEGAAPRGGARRGRSRRPPRVPGRLRIRSVRQAEAARAGARTGERLRGRTDRRLVSARARISPRSAPPSLTRRGSSTSSARSRAPTWRC